MRYWTCPLCHANLDFGEKCDCVEETERKRQKIRNNTRKVLTTEKNGQFRFDFERMMST